MGLLPSKKKDASRMILEKTEYHFDPRYALVAIYAKYDNIPSSTHIIGLYQSWDHAWEAKEQLRGNKYSSTKYDVISVHWVAEARQAHAELKWISYGG